MPLTEINLQMHTITRKVYNHVVTMYNDTQLKSHNLSSLFICLRFDCRLSKNIKRFTKSILLSMGEGIFMTL